jgi:hypothetical protein
MKDIRSFYRYFNVSSLSFIIQIMKFLLSLIYLILEVFRFEWNFICIYFLL